MSVVQAHNLTITERAAWLRCEAAKDRRVYVPKGKTVARIDLSGFEVPNPQEYGVKALGGESFGAVKQQLSFEGTEAEILANLEKVLKFMATLSAVEKVKKAPKAKPATTEPDAPNGELTKRLDLIKKVAAQKGVPVAASTMATADKA